MRQARCDLTEIDGIRFPVGTPKITPGGGLPSKYYIHAVGPNFNHVRSIEGTQLLTDAYQPALDLAKELRLQSLGLSPLPVGKFRGKFP